MAESFSPKTAKRIEAARGVLANQHALTAAAQRGVPAEKLSAIVQLGQDAESADQRQRTKKEESIQRSRTFSAEMAVLAREYTEFRQLRETRKAELQGAADATLLAVLNADYTVKVQVARTNEAGDTSREVVDSTSYAAKLQEVTRAVSAVLEHAALVDSFAAISYGAEKLRALLTRAEQLQALQQEAQQLRKESEDATQQERAAVGALNGLWKLYGPLLRRVAVDVPLVRALLQDT